MHNFFIIALIIFSISINAEIGITSELPTTENDRIIGSARMWQGQQKSLVTEKKKFDSKNWNLLEEYELNHYLQADSYMGIEYDSSNNTMNIVTDLPEIIEEAQNAVDKAPKWLQPSLTNTFSLMGNYYQQIMAEVILSAQDPYIDEIAFAIANLSTQYLSSEFCNTQIFVDNAEMIYQIASELDYVEVVDYGSSNNEDYYSTTSYIKLTTDDQVVDVEVPREIYYMYIVMPKITDEIPAYIDPALEENNYNHTSNITNPQSGYLWRDFLYNHSDEGYPLLSEMLSGVQYLWDEQSLENTNAIGTINSWITSTLEFNSDSERPHQPVRIYRKHKGRCGEHADLTAAATRTALIPCTSILSYSGDHTWNEFWDEEWIHWEPVNNYVNNPLVYENGWGKVFGSVFEIKSNGNLKPVTSKYSEGCAYINVHVEDSEGNAVDGARITLMVNESGLTYDNFGYTDSNGEYIFEVGESKSYAVRMDSELGSDPENSNEYYEVTAAAEEGETYQVGLTSSQAMEIASFTTVEEPDAPEDMYKIVFDYEVEKQIITGSAIFDDLDNTGEIDSPIFYDAKNGGFINFYMTDIVNYFSMAGGFDFETFNPILFSEAATTTFYPPTSDWWYNCLKNRLLKTPILVSGNVSFYEFNVNNDDTPNPASTFLAANYPNPFNPSTTIYYQADSPKSRLKIFNLKGEVVRSYDLNTKQGEIVWEGTDERGNKVASGLYFYKLEVNKQVRKMILLK
ncbi:MAG: FlgD immunoglobulin-like domain containing protein [Candidatus Cloacimonadota bacterium]|nr:FlgD immunoglobulin-like domain containing protein [Candidatus Cloacimonadota bacterium]